jgi:hypothetical protein
VKSQTTLLVFLFTILFLSSAPNSLLANANLENQCSHLQTECSFYECAEQELECGKRGYPLGYGLKYCSRFEQFLDRFSQKGLEWMNRTRKCLTKEFAKINSANSCRQLKKLAFKSHVPCYIKSGYCELSQHDQRAINRVVWPSLWRLRSIAAGIQVKYICYRGYRSYNYNKIDPSIPFNYPPMSAPLL